MLSITACGGGSSSSKKTPLPLPAENVSPVITLEAPESASSFTTINISANATDSDGSIEVYLWEQTSGIPVEFSQLSNSEISFEAPETTGAVEFSITVTDNEGASTSSSVSIDIEGPLVGQWHREGYHQYLAIDVDDVRLLQYTPNTLNEGQGWCLNGGSLPTEMLQGFAPISYSDDFANMSFDPIYLGDDDGVRYYQRVELPNICQNGAMLTSEDPDFTGSAIDDFELFWHAFNAHYPFFELRNKDWQQEYDDHKSQVSSTTTPEELAEIFASMLDGISDGHVSIMLDEEEVEINTGWIESPIFQRLYQQYAAQKGGVDSIESFWEYYQERINYADDIIQDNYVVIEKFYELAEEAYIAWGTAEHAGYDNIGYLKLGTFAVEEDSEEGYLRFLEYIDEAMEDMQTTDGLIIDLRLNGGGAETIGFYLASYFTNEKLHVFDKQVKNNHGISEKRPYYITPHISHAIYSKNVRILTDSWSGSAAETFPMMMRVLPQVEIIGERSAGDTASQLTKLLPFSLMEVNIPNTIYTTFDGLIFEDVGVPVDSEVLDFTEQDLINQTDSVIEAALESFKG